MGKIVAGKFQIRKVHFSLGRTINLGNFESVRLDIGAEAVVAEDADPAVVYDELRDWVNDRLIKEEEEIGNDYASG